MFFTSFFDCRRLEAELDLSLAPELVLNFSRY
jgi:hypothetical protein